MTDWLTWLLLKIFLVLSQTYCSKEDPNAKNCLIVCASSRSPLYVAVKHIKFEILNGAMADFPFHQKWFYMSQHLQKWYWHLQNIFYLKKPVCKCAYWWLIPKNPLKEGILRNTVQNRLFGLYFLAFDRKVS